MDLRQRRAGNSTDELKDHVDVSLGPAIYAGERYGKLSERLKRRGKVDTTSRTNQILWIQLLGFVIALAVVLSIVISMHYQSFLRKQPISN
uniref:AlNc14C364G11032 protein n=1 Tax=Albugo laibachii Nc14 TaxID=890382 RepID=F0WXU5_9STRA|nr:AlNc14C364G11032 [Albugo laibachii Nc14]|eukprot:CCA26293.1 AlNc14C364G11032 [Albugo laibachii Nc14]